jgi:hypothetical protein
MRGLMRCIAVCTVIVLLGSSISEAREPMDANRVRQMVMRRGIGKGVKVTESDGTRITGVLTAIENDSFEVTPKNTFQPTLVRYTDVERVQGDTSTAAKVGKGIAIGAGAYAAAGVVLLLVVVAVATH